MTAALNASTSVELATLERSGLIESRHLGAAVVVDKDGAILAERGDSSALVYPRSALKPLQAFAVLSTGVGLRPVQAVLASASHAGTPDHVAVVESILHDAGLDASALQCPPAWPVDEDARVQRQLAGAGRASVTMNCSGKHAAFLLACVQNDWPVDSYLAVDHPLQQHIRSTIERVSGEPILHSGIDGCGAPVHALGLAGLARGVSRVAGPRAEPPGRFLAEAIRAHGWALDGIGRANTVAIDRLGVVAKGGAEGVMIMVTPDGTSVAVKILDGSMRAATLVALELLVSVGAIERAGADEVLDATLERVLGGGTPVGAIRPTL